MHQNELLSANITHTICIALKCPLTADVNNSSYCRPTERQKTKKTLPLYNTTWHGLWAFAPLEDILLFSAFLPSPSPHPHETLSERTE